MLDEVIRTARSRLRARGAVDATLLARRERDLHALTADWELEPETIYADGVGFPVLAGCLPDGTRAILKLGVPAQEARVLLAADGAGYARVLAWDGEREALLLEKLGLPLGRSRLTVVEQCRVAARVLATAWRVPLRVATTLPGGKAAGLLAIIDRWGPAADVPGGVLARARDYAQTLGSSETAEVTCHGDPHPGNCLQRGESWAYIDPDGFAGERAYDLGVVLRGFTREFAAAEAYRPGGGTTLLRAACAALAAESGVDEERIWAWSYVERVTTGLYLGALGRVEEGAQYLQVAARLR